MFWIIAIFVGIALLLIINAIGTAISDKDSMSGDKDFDKYVLDSSDDDGRPRVHESFKSWKERQ